MILWFSLNLQACKTSSFIVHFILPIFNFTSVKLCKTDWLIAMLCLRKVYSQLPRVRMIFLPVFKLLKNRCDFHDIPSMVYYKLGQAHSWNGYSTVPPKSQTGDPLVLKLKSGHFRSNPKSNLPIFGEEWTKLIFYVGCVIPQLLAFLIVNSSIINQINWFTHCVIWILIKMIKSTVYKRYGGQVWWASYFAREFTVTQLSTWAVYFFYYYDYCHV